MNKYRVRLTTAQKALLWADSPEDLVYLVEKRFMGFFWVPVDRVFTENAAKNVVRKLKERDASIEAARQFQDQILEG